MVWVKLYLCILAYILEHGKLVLHLLTFSNNQTNNNEEWAAITSNVGVKFIEIATIQRFNLLSLLSFLINILFI